MLSLFKKNVAPSSPPGSPQSGKKRFLCAVQAVSMTRRLTLLLKPKTPLDPKEDIRNSVTHAPKGTLRFVYSQCVVEAFERYGPLLGAGQEVSLPRTEICIDKLPEMYKDMLYMRNYSQRMRARRATIKAEKERLQGQQKLPVISNTPRLSRCEETPPDTRGSIMSLAMTSSSSMDCVSSSQEKLPSVFMTSTRTLRSRKKSR